MRVQLHSPPCGCTVHPSKGLRVFNDTFSLQGQTPALPCAFFPSTWSLEQPKYGVPSSANAQLSAS